MTNRTIQRSLIAALEKSGFELLRRCDGAHVVYHRPQDNRQVTFTTNIRDKNLVRRVLKAAGLSQKKL